MKTTWRWLAGVLMGGVFAFGGCEGQAKELVLNGAEGAASTLSQALITAFFDELAQSIR